VAEAALSESGAAVGSPGRPGSPLPGRAASFEVAGPLEVAGAPEVTRALEVAGPSQVTAPEVAGPGRPEPAPDSWDDLPPPQWAPAATSRADPLAHQWTPAGEFPAAGAASPAAAARDAIGGPGRPQIAVRTALAALLGIFLAANIVADWLHAGQLTGPAVLAGCVAAAWYTRRRELLMIVAAPPAIFLAAVIIAEMITAQGHTVTATSESVFTGSLITLSSAAPWLFAAMLAIVVITMARGLPQCVRELRGELRGDQLRHRGPGQLHHGGQPHGSSQPGRGQHLRRGA